MLADAWGDHPQFAKIVERIRSGSCSIHSDTISLSCSIALRAIEAALRSQGGGEDDLIGIREAASDLLASRDAFGGSKAHQVGYRNDLWDRLRAALASPVDGEGETRAPPPEAD